MKYLEWTKCGAGYLGTTSDGTHLFSIEPARKRRGWDLIRRSGSRETVRTLQEAKNYGDGLARASHFKPYPED